MATKRFATEGVDYRQSASEKPSASALQSPNGLTGQRVKHLFDLAGIAINGSRPWDIRVKDKRFYRRLALQGSLALGESYMDGWWECTQVDQFLCRLIEADVGNNATPWMIWAHQAMHLLMNMQNPARAFEVGERHYDIGNDMYRAMLDHHMQYSCGYWAQAENLEQAQQHKLELIAEKLRLQPGMRVLDVGCGWGGLARHLALNHDVEVVGLTISKQQAQLAQQWCENLPVEIRIQDYRELQEPFDRVVSVGMFEHVGFKNYRTYMETISRCLAPHGLFLLHTIGGNRSVTQGDPWLSRYIFPNSMLPSVKQIADATEGLMIMEDWHNFGADYDPTLMAWYHNFQQHWPTLREKYGQRFYRMWEYYLLSCAAVFRTRRTQLWQLVLSPDGVPGGYRSPR